MFSSGVFDYINVLDKAADAAWTRNDLIANNIANASTPDYKRQDIDFEGTLQKAIKNSKSQDMDSKVANLNRNRLNASTYTDYGDYSYRLDGNNVDIDQENTELASNTIKYQALINSINKDFSNLKLVQIGRAHV